MAELATIARPYAEALFQVAKSQDLAAWGQQLDALAQVAQDADLRQFADHPKAQAQQVFDVMATAAKTPLASGVQNFLRTVIENGRLAALPTIVAQYHVLANAASGVSDAQIYSAFDISADPSFATVLVAQDGVTAGSSSTSFKLPAALAPEKTYY